MDEILARIRDGRLTGAAALDALAATEAVLFHGSQQELAVLQPRRSTTYDQQRRIQVPDGPAAVWAADDPRIAIFMAVMPAAGEGPRFSGYGYDASGERVFVAVPNSLTRRDSATGVVHVVGRDGFEHLPERGEWRSTSPVPCLAAVAVGGDDLPPIRIFASADDVAEAGITL